MGVLLPDLSLSGKGIMLILWIWPVALGEILWQPLSAEHAVGSFRKGILVVIATLELDQRGLFRRSRMIVTRRENLGIIRMLGHDRRIMILLEREGASSVML